MNCNTLMTFEQLRLDAFVPEDEDFFQYTFAGTIDGDEKRFAEFIRKSKMIIGRFGDFEHLRSFALPESKWLNLCSRYEQRCIESQIDIFRGLPEFFESTDPNGAVYALLPNTYDSRLTAPYKVSIHDNRGVESDPEFGRRDEALKYLAGKRCKPTNGALDLLTEQDSWNRGIYIRLWYDKHGCAERGFEVNKHRDDVRRLFPERY
ncbi:hypothetical protein [Vibrio mediterranei]|uniref:hypothetical protein n=1 Tax=Vibrio mediterranei TaxID=689 RepID=UPI0040687DFC